MISPSMRLLRTHDNSKNVSYSKKASQAASNTHGLIDGYIVHNPGALPEAPYFGDPSLSSLLTLSLPSKIIMPTVRNRSAYLLILSNHMIASDWQ